MRRPDVFTLDYSHPLAQGLVLASMLRRGRDESLRNLHGAIVNIPDSSWYIDPEIGRYAVLFSGGADHIAHPYKLSAVDFGNGGTYAAWLNFGTTSTDEYNGSWGAPRVYLGKQGQTHVFGWGSGFGYGITGAATPNVWTHLALTNNGSSSIFYVNGIQVGTASQTFSGTQANNFGVGLCIGVGRPMRGPVSDTVLYNRPLSPAEIAILADRTDPMLGGLIVEERPVLYFDMGGSAEVEGSLAISHAVSLGIHGSKGSVTAVSFSHPSSVGFAGIKEIRVALTITHDSVFGVSGIKEEFGLGEGALTITHQSTFGIGGIKEARGPLTITHAALFGVAGITGVLMPELSNAVGVGTGPRSAAGNVTTNKANGTLYAVLALSASKPSIVQIQAGQNHLGNPALFALNQPVTTTGEQSVECLSGLEPHTVMYWHFQHKDDVDQDSSVITSPAFSTLDIMIEMAFANAAPAYLQAFLAMSNLSMSDAELKALLDGE